MAFRWIKFETQKYDATYIYDADKSKWNLQPKTPVEGQSQMTRRKATLADIGKVVYGKRAWEELHGKAHANVSGVLVHFIDTMPPMAIVRCQDGEYLTTIYGAEVESTEPMPRYRDMIPDDLDAGERYGEVSNNGDVWIPARIVGHHRASAFPWSAVTVINGIQTYSIHPYARLKVN
jgi:hypothetical protein